MTVKQMTDSDKAVILQCLEYIYVSDEVEEPEFRTRLGITRPEMKSIIDKWPDVEDASTWSDAELAINNSMVEVCYGIDIATDRWARSFSVPKSEVERIYKRWSTMRGHSPGGIR